MTVSSKDNQYVKEWRNLCRDARARRDSGLFAIEGARLCGDALATGVPVHTVLYTPAARETYSSVVEGLIAAAERAVEITDTVSRHMADTANPQGVFCVVKHLDILLSFDTINNMGRYGVLENIQDPGNLGTMIRTAEALGLDGLLLSTGCCDVYNPKVLRGSMGGVFRLPLWRTEDLPTTLTALQQRGMTAYACVVDPSARSVTEATFSPGSLCVIGNEGSGLTAATVEACHQRVTIRMAGRAESLNASMAAGIVMWEMTR
ncbi:MAG: RNA methyltransferase [Ruminococcaceae bacterium]|nr:RNA methyltransferase [Oscillospiraceae bacterium]